MDMRKKLAFLATGMVFGMVAAIACAETAAEGGSSQKISPRAAAGDLVGILLERARYWENRDRPDLAREALDKLFNIAPDHPDGLAVMGLIEARVEHLDSARAILGKLRGVKPGHPAISRIEALIRLHGEDKDRLRQARLLAKAGHEKEALAAFRKLYPNGPPTGDLALEYWQLVADAGGEWSSARDGLSMLARENPENLRYRLALAEHETSRLPLKMQALKIIIDMAKLPEYSRQARKSWRRALMLLENAPANLPLLNEYLAAEPDDSAIKERRQSIIQAEEAHRRMMADPNYRAKAEISLLDKTDIASAEPLLEEALRLHPADADVVGEMGLLRLRQGRHAQAHELFVKALNLTHGRSSKWRSLAKTAQFWQLVRESGDARDAGDLTLAENKLHAARRLDPGEPNAIAALARIHADRGQFGEAESGYRQALSIEPLNGSALNGLLSLYRRQGMETEARQTIAQLSADQRGVLGASLYRMEAAMLQDRADRLSAEGRHDEAVALLEQAVQMDADDPWLRFNLAKHYARRNDPGRGRALLDDLAARHPENPDALHALALYQSGQDDVDGALETLNRAGASKRSREMEMLQKRLLIRSLGRNARSLARSGRKNEAEQALSEAEAVSSGNEALTLEVAFEWANIGDMQRGRALFDRAGAAHAPPSIAWRLRHAEFLAMIGSDQELHDELSMIAGIGSLSPSEAETLVGLQESAAIRRADKQTLAGNAALAHQTLAPFLEARPDRVRLLLADARAYRAERQWAAAQGSYKRILQLDQSDREARVGLVETLMASGNRAAALQQVSEWAVGNMADGLPARLHLAGLFVDLEEYARAQDMISPLLVSYPNDSRVLDMAWKISEKSGRLDEAIIYLKRTFAAEQAEQNPSGGIPR